MTDDLLRLSHDADGAIVVQGDVDHSTRWMLARAIDGSMATTIIVDLAGCTYLDSSGLAVLLRGARRAELEGRALVVRRPSATTQRVIELTGALVMVAD